MNTPEAIKGYGLENEELRERLRWLIKLRWIGIVGVFTATHIVREVAFLSFPLLPVYIILGFVALYNLYFRRYLEFPAYSPRRLAAAQIFLDQFTLSLAMYFSGGCDSPFIYFFIFHIVISGILLPWKNTVVFAVLAVVFPAVVMGLKHIGVLPHYGIFKNEPVLFTDMAVIGSYGLAFVTTIFLTAYFVTYLSKRLYEKNEEVRRLYDLSERLRSSIRITEVISIIEKELCGFTGVGKSSYLPLDKNKRTLLFKAPGKEIRIPLVDRNSFTEALLKGTAMTIDYKTISSDYEKEVLSVMGSGRSLILPVIASSISACHEYFNCNDKECGAYGAEAGRCWQYAESHCRGRILRSYLEKLEACLSCELFTPIGLYVLNIPRDYMPFQKVDVDACLRLLDAAGLAVSNALLYEKTLSLSKTDGLTGLQNYREFKEAFESEVLRASRYHRKFSVIMLDLDNFKNYNDTHGHPQGDILIKRVADLIRENLKDTDVVARYGGEEFGILLLETPKEEGMIVAERLRLMLDWCRFPKEETQPGGKVTASLGVCGYPEDGDTCEMLLAAADAALYRAKREGKNRVVAAGTDVGGDTPS
jgi:diguanylate cyclase (GGDEF)-like protein